MHADILIGRMEPRLPAFCDGNGIVEAEAEAGFDVEHSGFAARGHHCSHARSASHSGSDGGSFASFRGGSDGGSNGGSDGDFDCVGFLRGIGFPKESRGVERNFLAVGCGEACKLDGHASRAGDAARPIELRNASEDARSRLGDHPAIRNEFPIENCNESVAFQISIGREAFGKADLDKSTSGQRYGLRRRRRRKRSIGDDWQLRFGDFENGQVGDDDRRRKVRSRRFCSDRSEGFVRGLNAPGRRRRSGFGNFFLRNYGGNNERLRGRLGRRRLHELPETQEIKR